MIWKDIRGFTGRYQVNKKGDVKSVARYRRCVTRLGEEYYKWHKEIMLRPYKGHDGYLYYVLTRKDKEIKNKHIAKHRLVAIYFIPNPKRKPEVNHIDYNRLNNNINNLEWVTSKENTRHTINGNRGSICVPGEKNPAAKLKEFEVLEIRKAIGSNQYIADQYGVSRRAISFIKNRERWKHLS